MNLLTQNSKMKKTSIENNTKIFNFSISAYNNKKTGKITCPFAKECKKFCYAQKGNYTRYPKITELMDKKHEITLSPEFVELMQSEITKKKPNYVRIHDSGDFYSKEYINKWLTIVSNNPDINFYAYTKSFVLFEGFNIPDNLTLIYSFGGKYDNKIDTSINRHAKIFESIEQLKKSGYIDASNNDLKAIGKNHKIGLIAH